MVSIGRKYIFALKVSIKSFVSRKSLVSNHMVIKIINCTYSIVFIQIEKSQFHFMHTFIQDIVLYCTLLCHEFQLFVALLYIILHVDSNVLYIKYYAYLIPYSAQIILYIQVYNNCDIAFLTVFTLTHHVKFSCGRKSVHLEKTHDFRRSVD